MLVRAILVVRLRTYDPFTSVGPTTEGRVKPDTPFCTFAEWTPPIVELVAGVSTTPIADGTVLYGRWLSECALPIACCRPTSDGDTLGLVEHIQCVVPLLIITTTPDSDAVSCTALVNVYWQVTCNTKPSHARVPRASTAHIGK
jgi:hypothetical protein